MQRKDLKDYFPQTSEHFQGYIQMAVFREKLYDVLRTAKRQISLLYSQEYTILSDPPQHVRNEHMYIKDFTPIKSEPDPKYEAHEFRNSILEMIDFKEWKPITAMRDFASENRPQQDVYWKSAGKEVLSYGLSFGIGKAVKGVQNVLKNPPEILSKIKIDPKTKVGQTVDSVLATHSTKNGLLKINVAGTVTGVAINSAFGLNKKQGFELKFQTKENKERLKNYGVPERVADFIIYGGEKLNNDKNIAVLVDKTGISSTQAKYILDSVVMINLATNPGSFINLFGIAGTLDIATDLMPHKSAVNAFYNCLLAWRTRKSARVFDESASQNEKLWDEFATKLKAKIKQDINSLSDKELIDLCELLGINENE